VAFVLAVDQVGRPGTGNLFVHEYDRSAVPPSNRTYAVMVALNSTLPLGVRQAADTPAPPPTPLLSFQETTPPLAFEGAVLSGYDFAFASRFFHSEFDNATNIDAFVVTGTATALARTLYALATNASTPAAAAALVPPSLQANGTLVAEMVACITVNARCPLFKRVLGVNDATLAQLVPAGPLTLYTSIYNQPYALPNNGYVLQPTPLEAFVRNSLAFSSATVRNGTCAATSDCTTRLRSKLWECLQGTCVLANAFYHDALSPALSPTGTPNKYTITRAAVTPTDPVWTEPYWSVRIGVTSFLKDSAVTDGVVLGVGLAVTTASVWGVWALIRWLDTHYKVP
jgi:hypothetical protein